MRALPQKPKTPRKRKTENFPIPLPAKSMDRSQKPFFYWPDNGQPNPVDVTLNKFGSYRTMTPRRHAIEIVALSDTFTKKPWLQRIRLACCLTKREVKKQVLNSGKRVTIKV